MSKMCGIPLRVLERSLVTLGLVLLGFYVLARIEGVVTLHAALRNFEESKTTGAQRESRLPPPAALRTDTSLWSGERIKAYKISMRRNSDRPLAVLRIRRLQLEAPVFDVMDDITLNAGVAHIQGTARPDQRGNIGIAGHRDGFFRCLKDIAKGDTIELVTPKQTRIFVVQQTTVTKPDDVRVLRPPKPGLTLVTCYPFYFVGSAPDRYIVQAYLK